VDIEAEHVAAVGFEERMAQMVKALAGISGISETHANELVRHGWTTLEDLAQADAADLAEIPEIGEAAASLLEAARAEVARRTLKIGESSAV